MFAYCGNSPVLLCDPTGKIAAVNNEFGAGSTKGEIIKPKTGSDVNNRKTMVCLLQKFGLDDLIPGYESIVTEMGATATYSVVIVNGERYNPGTDWTEVGINTAGFGISFLSFVTHRNIVNGLALGLSSYSLWSATHAKISTIIPTDVAISQIHVEVEWSYTGLNGLPHQETVTYDYFYCCTKGIDNSIIDEKLYYKYGTYEKCLFSSN